MAPETEHFPDLFCLITGHTGGIAAFFDLPCEKILPFQVKDFRRTAFFGGATPDRGIRSYPERRTTEPRTTLFAEKLSPLALPERGRYSKTEFFPVFHKGG